MNILSSERRPLRESMVWRMLVVGILMLLLLIPLGMVRSQIEERQERRNEAVREVASSWGGEQLLGGPLLSIPFQVHGKDDKGNPTVWTDTAHFLPETLKVEGRVEPERRSRGIFDVVLYRSDLHLTGTFRPDFSHWRIAPGDILWEDGFLTLGVPDMRGIRRTVRLDWQGRTLALSPGGAESGVWSSGLRAGVPGLAAAQADGPMSFDFRLGLDGSGPLHFLPMGKQTTVALRSSWPDPKFVGAFLPESRRVTGTGFEAVWNVSYFGRSYPQHWLGSEAPWEQQRDNVVAVEEFSRGQTGQVVSRAETGLSASAFGVELFLPVDVYQKTERSVKYAVLFLLLTFLTFFLYEVFSPFSLHPMQYLLVGSALCLFYLLLLSLSEHTPFGLAYTAASVATVLLISGYSLAILRGRLRALVMAGVLGLLYGYLYVLLQAEDYALLLGSIGLFLILALVMYVTRRIDWYAPRPGKAREVEA
ncbi:MAG TPA: cell envelope integrity protein CreD [Thermoanaerobaculia bacterium]|nr:cell envelope integrity protein CreD [Thermoanaerobaculia bacterium]